MKYCIDDLKVKAGTMYCAGWAAPDREGLALRVRLTGKSGKEVQCNVEYRHRPDVAGLVYQKNEPDLFGFAFSHPYPDADFSQGDVPVLRLEGMDGEECAESMDVELTQVPDLEALWKRSHSLPRRVLHFLKAPDKRNFLLEERFDALEGEEKKYAIWKENSRPGREEIKNQKSFAVREDPLISFVMPVYRPELSFLRAMVASVLGQTCRNFELCIACAGTEEDSVKDFLKQTAERDDRVKIIHTDVNKGISAQTNAAIGEAKGSWIAFIDQDDLLEKNLLYEYLRVIRYREADVIYCDEDKLDTKTGFFGEPNFKPDYNPDLLSCNNYICHMLMVRRDLLDQAGLLDPRFDGAQDHELLLRLSELTNRFVHIPKVLYSWRVHSLSTSANPESKSAAYDAGAEAIKEHFARTGLTADVYPMANRGWYRSEFTLKEHPLVSIIIPNRDHSEDLARCVRSLQEVSTYQETEILIVENNSTDSAVFALYDELKKDERVKVITWDRPFNYSAINNFAAGQAKGEYLLLLNNDTEVITPDFLTSMMAYAMREDVGAVGARLLYPDGTVQHAGVLVGVSEGADHVFLKYADADPGYMGRSVVSQDMSAVTGACLLTKKELYLRLKGLDEEFTVAYNDVDYCLKLRDAGCFVVYDAFAKLTHYESKSRGYEDSEEKQARFEQEKQLLRKKWRKLSLGDPYYNINLSLKNGYYRLP